MVEQLFGSKTRVKLLQLFYSNPNRSFYVREITRKIDEQINSVRRELANLLNIGIITSETSNNNRLYYEVDQSFKHYKPLKSIFGDKVFEGQDETQPANEVATEEPKQEVEPKEEITDSQPVVEAQTEPQDPLVKTISAVGKVDLAMLLGQFTRDERSGVDMLLVGDINQSRVAKAVSDMEASERKVINYAVLSTDEYIYRLQINDRFIGEVLASKKQVIINSQDLKVNI